MYHDSFIVFLLKRLTFDNHCQRFLCAWESIKIFSSGLVSTLGVRI